jgi:hypothetical protein
LKSAKERNKHKINMVAPLHRADGSATATANGYTVIGAVNGPLEVQRRDELPEEATIEVNIRPATGVASMSSSSLSNCFPVDRIMADFTKAPKNATSKASSTPLSSI